MAPKHFGKDAKDDTGDEDWLEGEIMSQSWSSAAPSQMVEALGFDGEGIVIRNPYSAASYLEVAAEAEWVAVAEQTRLSDPSLALVAC